MTASFRSSCLAFAFVLCLPSLAQAATLNVPTTQYPTIQAAVNASANGDTVLIADGTYTGDGNRDIDFNGKNITVTSVNGAAKTIIDCQGTSSAYHRGFYIHNGETNAVISGLTIENGYVDGGGGGIADLFVTLTVQNCVISHNTSDQGTGGGISSYNSDGTITVSHCTITGNTSYSNGGGIQNYGEGTGNISIVACTITSNTVTTFPGFGGGVSNENFEGGTLSETNCVIYGNTSPDGGGIGNLYDDSSGPIVVTNCTVAGNTATHQGGGIFDDATQGNNPNFSPLLFSNNIVYGDTVLVSANGNAADHEIVSNPSSTAYAAVVHCDVQGGYAGTGNINADPRFVSATDFHLQAGSPCLGAGTTVGAPATDFDGNARPSPPSIGAYDIAPAPAAVTTHVLWNNANGAASIWNYNTTGGSYTHAEYGPYASWTAKALADGGTDGLTRVLWTNTDGRMSLWSLNNATGTFTQNTFGPFPGWTASALSVGTDNTTHILWTNTNGQASVWNYSTSNGTYMHQEYGPYANWTAMAMADGGTDGKTRVLWNNGDGRLSLWSLDNTAGVFSQNTFGPFGGWTATAL